MSIDKALRIPDRNTNEAIKKIEKIAEEGKNGNFQIMDKEITYSDAGKLTEGKRYIDIKKDGTKRIVMKIGTELFFSNLNPMEK